MYALTGMRQKGRLFIFLGGIGGEGMAIRA